MRLALMVIMLALALAACGGGDQDEPQAEETPTPESTVGRYEQTWAKGYGETSCLDWRARMDDHQRFVMARDLLVELRRKTEPDDSPEDALVQLFADNIGIACERARPELELDATEAAAELYNSTSDYLP